MSNQNRQYIQRSALGCAIKLAVLDCEDRRKIKIAGYFHDIGRLAIPLEILQKRGRFTREDFSAMKTHPYHAFRVMSPIHELEDIILWVAYHHERLDGSGYPFGVRAEMLCSEARLVAIADVFTAISEDRPYRKGLSERERKRLLNQMADDRLPDGDIMALLTNNFDEPDGIRSEVQSAARSEFRSIQAALSESDAS